MVLLGVLTALAALVGYVIGWLLEGEASDAVPLWSRLGLFAAALMAVVSVGWSMISLAFGDKMVLTMANAREIDKADAPQLYNVVEEMAIAAGVPMPRVMVLETDALNAFATGNKVGHGTIVVTRGLLDTLSRDVRAVPPHPKRPDLGARQARRQGGALSRSEPCHAASLHRQSGADLHRQVVGAHGHASRYCRPYRSPAQSGRLAWCLRAPSTCRAIAGRAASRRRIRWRPSAPPTHSASPRWRPISPSPRTMFWSSSTTPFSIPT